MYGFYKCSISGSREKKRRVETEPIRDIYASGSLQGGKLQAEVTREAIGSCGSRDCTSRSAKVREVRAAGADIGAIAAKSQEDRKGPPLERTPSPPQYSGLPQRFGPIVITLNHPPPAAPSRRLSRKAGPISTLPVDRKCTRVAA